MTEQEIRNGAEDKKVIGGQAEKDASSLPVTETDNTDPISEVDVTPRNIDPSDKKSAEPHITDEETP